MTSRTTIILYSSMSFTAALLMQFFQSKAQFFYIVELKLEPSLYSIAIGIWALYNSINDPLFGWIMDRKPTRWGRRVPWILAFMIPLGIAFGFVWDVPTFLYGDQIMIFIWLILMLLAFDTGYTIVILAWTALFPEMFSSTEDRSWVSAIRQIFSIIALVVALVIPPTFVHDGDIRSYAYFGWILAAISTVNVLIATLGCKETDLSEENSYSLKEGISILRSNRDYQAFLFVNMVTYFAYGQLLAMLPFFRKFVLKIDEQFETSAYAAALGVTLLALVVWVKFTVRRGAKSTFVYSAVFFSFSLVPVWFITDPILLIINMGIVGFGLAGLLMIVDILLAEIVDKDFEKTGKRREGVYFGFNGFFIRMSILMQAFSLFIVSELTGFDQFLDEQTALGQVGIKIQMLVLPIIMLFLGIYVIRKYYTLSN